VQLLFAVGFDVVVGGVLGVLRWVNVVAVGQVGMVRGGFVVAFGVVPGGFAVMARSVFVMLRCLGVMMSGLMRHMSPLVQGCSCTDGLSAGGARGGVTAERNGDENSGGVTGRRV